MGILSMTPGAGLVLMISILVWVVSEIRIGMNDIRARSRKTKDAGSRAGIRVTLYVGMILAICLYIAFPYLSFQSIYWFTLGIVLIWAGLIFRLWAFKTLGRLFNTKVMVQREHRVVTNGPYKYVRNPSYTGLAAIFLGLGLAFGNYLSIIVILAIPLIGLYYRISVEEKVLVKALGKSYTDYMKKVRYRLIPYIW